MSKLSELDAEKAVSFLTRELANRAAPSASSSKSLRSFLDANFEPLVGILWAFRKTQLTASVLRYLDRQDQIKL